MELLTSGTITLHSAGSVLKKYSEENMSVMIQMF